MWELSLFACLVTMALLSARAGPQQCQEPFLASEKEWETAMKNDGRFCLRLKDACIDANSIIIYDLEEIRKSQMSWAGVTVKVPDGGGKKSWPGEGLEDFFKHTRRSHNETVYGSPYAVEQIALRLPSEGEYAKYKKYEADKQERPDLNLPPFFSLCTVPVLMAGHHISTNVAEFTGRIPGAVHLLTRNSSQMFGSKLMDGNVTLVVHNLGSLPLSPWQRHTLQPYTTLEPTTTARFGMRHHPSAPSNYSQEGTWGTQCYKKIVLCRFNHGNYNEAYNVGRKVVQHYQPKWEPYRGKFWSEENKPSIKKTATHFVKQLLGLKMEVDVEGGAGVLQGMAEEQNGGAGGEGTSKGLLQGPGGGLGGGGRRSLEEATEKKVLRVLFEIRTGSVGTRDIMNLSDIMNKCATHEGWDKILVDSSTGATLYDRVVCKSHAFARNFLEDLSIMQETDVFFAIHGAGCMNSIFLPEGGSFVELRPFQAGTTNSWLTDMWWPQICRGVHHSTCWFLNVDEDGSYTPGSLEVKGMTGDNKVFHARDRNIIFKFSYLEFLLPKIVSVSRQPLKKWKTMYENQQVAFTVVSNGTIVPAYNTKGDQEFFEKHGKTDYRFPEVTEE